MDLIVVGTVTPDMMYPSTACLVQHKLGIASTWGFDVSAGCSGFLYALNTGTKFVESGQYKKVLVIGSDVNSSMVNYETGPCASSSVTEQELSCSSQPRRENRELSTMWPRLRASAVSTCICPRGGSLNPASHETVDKKMHYIHQDGQQVFKYAVKKMAEMTQRILERNRLTGSDIDCFIAHQANRRIIMATADRLKMPEDKVIVNIDRYGNTTAGTIPLAMQTALESGKLKKGSLVMLAAVGAGFTSGATLLRWAY